MITNDRDPWLDLAVFGELGDKNAREQQAMKALEAREKFDHDMRETEVGQNLWIIYRNNF